MQSGINTVQEKQSLALLPLKITSKQVVVLGLAHYLPNKNSRIPIYLRVGGCRAIAEQTL